MSEAERLPSGFGTRSLSPCRLCLQPLGGLLLQKLPEVADQLHLLELRFGQLDVVLVLHSGDELDEVERVGREILGEALVELYLVRLNAEDLGGELLELLEIEWGCHHKSPSWPRGL